MRTRDNVSEVQAKTLAVGLSLLTKLQYEALQRSSYLRMSQSEAEAYDERRIRIGQICEILVEVRENAS
jgi:hypothetical protein